MMGRTHVLIGMDAVWWVKALPPIVQPDPGTILLCFVAAGLGSLLPDLDAQSSLLQNLSLLGVRPFRLFGVLIAPSGHRGLLHSQWGILLIAFVTFPLALWSVTAWISLVLGFCTHLAADACTRGGIRFRYPDQSRYHLLPRPLLLVTGSPPEDLVFALAACTLVLLILRIPLAPTSFSPF